MYVYDYLLTFYENGKMAAMGMGMERERKRIFRLSIYLFAIWFTRYGRAEFIKKNA